MAARQENSLCLHTQRGFAGSHYLPPPSHHAIAFIPLDVSTNKARYHKNIPTHLEMIGECGREKRCCCVFESLQSASSALFFRFNANILFKCVGVFLKTVLDVSPRYISCTTTPSLGGRDGRIRVNVNFFF